MDGALKIASSLGKSLGESTRQFFVGVFFPGLLILLSISSIYLFLYYPEKLALENIFLVVTDKRSAAYIIVFLLAVIGVSCVFGYLNRDFSFSISTMWLGRGLSPSRTIADVIDDLRITCGAERVDAVLKDYDVFKLESALSESGRKLPRPPEFYVREFCKLWLAAKGSDLNTSAVEQEINVMMGLVVPTALTSIPVALIGGSVFSTVIAIILVSSSLALFHRINKTRVMETEQAIRRFLFAHWVAEKHESRLPDCTFYVLSKEQLHPLMNS